MESIGPGEQHPAAAQEQDASDTKVFINFPGRRVERRPGNLVLKRGPRVVVAEREALAYAGTLNLPVPRLHDPPDSEATGEDAGGEIVSIWMDYVDGVVLEDVWPDMTAEQKMDIALQLREILTIMRQQTSPMGSKIASCGGGQLSDRRTYSVRKGGPFADEACFNDFQLDLHKQLVPEVVQKALAQALQQQQQHRVVFTHGDLTQHNIIIDKDSNRIQALIDWEFAGWFPEHWEFLKFVDMSPKNRDWEDYARYILPEQYLNELVIFEAVKRWQRP
ncbi:kinase-like domain-containing protein [Phyllosticta citribraziliensis]|uniref:Kinase-like domain-containing protein n=1 Tax=Phyllosticta citribraziliensis TaxID=989973 RepID=A0ABR1LRL5_9PEZI